MVSGPTIMLFDYKYWKQNKLFLDIVDQLRENKIYFENGKEAANHINQIWDNTLEWWNCEKTKKIRNIFISKLALTSNDPLNEWSETLNNIKKII